ncbi:putative formin-like protein 3 isoform X1 [Iris pallida]|uniref:Formin-like protein 3 isoform X1 n=1 Tax=Iris pallida TaxID=29817 RepID=A0AAX6EDN3_IRIPA|nr:putative formin-like protein 3 isoform X1 [Iris pallida]
MLLRRQAFRLHRGVLNQRRARPNSSSEPDLAPDRQIFPPQPPRANYSPGPSAVSPSSPMPRLCACRHRSVGIPAPGRAQSSAAPWVTAAHTSPLSSRPTSTAWTASPLWPILRG